MAGVMQSEYRCANDAWLSVVAAIRLGAVIEEEKADGWGRVCFLKLKQTPADQAGVMLDVVPERNAFERGDLLVAMHWLHKSPGPDENVSRRLAIKIESILNENGAKCCYCPVGPETQ